MTEIIEHGVVLSFDEIQILLYSMGIREVDGIYMPEKQFSECEIIRALHHMAEKGLITAVGTEFTIRKDLMEMLQVAGHPDSTMVCGQEAPPGVEYFCYIIPDRIVVSERYWKKNNTLKLRMFTTEAFTVWREQVTDDNSRD